MVRRPLPGERLFMWPRSNSVRGLLRFATLLGAVVWFVSPPALFLRLLPVVVAVPVMFLCWVAGFILLGRLARSLAPLPAQSFQAS